MGISVASQGDNQSGSQKATDTDWYTTEKIESSVRARRLANWMDGIDNTSWTKRWASLIFYRYMTGRSTGPANYNFSAVSRPGAANVYSRAVFEAPRYNVLAQCSDALANRVYKNRPFLQVCPIDGDHEARFNAKHLTNWMDGAFYDLDLWPVIEQCGADSRTWGDGFVKIDNGINNRLTATRILPDEIIVDENECNTGKVKHISIRVFVSRSDMENRYRNNAEALAAIRRAPKSQNGFYFGSDVDYTDVIVLREAWSIQAHDKDGNDIPGRHMLTVGEYAFTDEEWHRDHAPIARLPYQRMTTGYYSMGMPEIALGMQREVDRVMAAAWENFRRAAWPRIGLAQGSNVDPGKLGDKSNGIYYYSGGASMAPRFDFPMAMSPDQFRYLEDLIRRIKERFRVADQVAQGKRQDGISGVAVTKIDEMDDAAHSEQFQNLEDFVEEIGTLLIEAAEDSKPKVTLPGRNAQIIDWANLDWDQSKYFLRAFPVGRLSRSVAVRQQQIRDWYADGSISKQTKMRLEQVPDTDGYQSLANAASDYVEMQLDGMISTGKYSPPEPWIDVDSAYETASARWCYEKCYKTPQKRTDLILRYLSALDELKGAVQSAMAPMPGLGVPGMPGALPGAGPSLPGLPPSPGSSPAPGSAPIAPQGIPGLPNLQPGAAPMPPGFPV